MSRIDELQIQIAKLQAQIEASELQLKTVNDALTINKNKPEPTFWDPLKEIAKKLNINHLKERLNRWFVADLTAGSLASAAISALYGFVQKVGFYLPPHIVNFIFPMFVLSDSLGAIASWKQFHLLRLINIAENNGDKKNSLQGLSNYLARAILETLSAIGGATIIIGAIVTTAISAAVAATFAPFIAPGFMILIGWRVLFAAKRAIPPLIRCGKELIKAMGSKGQPQKDCLAEAKNIFITQALPQLLIMAQCGIGFVATTLVMLKQHFGLAFIGVAGGVALGGIMAYFAIGTHKLRMAQKKEKIELEAEKSGIELTMAKQNTLLVTLYNNKSMLSETEAELKRLKRPRPTAEPKTQEGKRMKVDLVGDESAKKETPEGGITPIDPKVIEALKNQSMFSETNAQQSQAPVYAPVSATRNTA